MRASITTRFPSSGAKEYECFLNYVSRALNYSKINRFQSRAAVTKTRCFYLHRRLRCPLRKGARLSYISHHIASATLKSRPSHSRRDITRQIYSTITCTIVTRLQKISGFSKAVGRHLETIPLCTHFNSSNIGSEYYGFNYAYKCSLILLKPFEYESPLIR